jgi:hypothetical protein
MMRFASKEAEERSWKAPRLYKGYDHQTCCSGLFFTMLGTGRCMDSLQPAQPSSKASYSREERVEK